VTNIKDFEKNRGADQTLTETAACDCSAAPLQLILKQAAMVL